MGNKRKQKQVIVVKSKERGARTRVTACAWSHDGKLIAGGTSVNIRRAYIENHSLYGRHTSRLGYHIKSR